jgi:23S rRNA G2069 N7-methylase RlmK/C1962 C5-methylase RlmI
MLVPQVKGPVDDGFYSWGKKLKSSIRLMYGIYHLVLNFFASSGTFVVVATVALPFFLEKR